MAITPNILSFTKRGSKYHCSPEKVFVVAPQILLCCHVHLAATISFSLKLDSLGYIFSKKSSFVTSIKINLYLKFKVNVSTITLLNSLYLLYFASFLEKL